MRGTDQVTTAATATATSTEKEEVEKKFRGVVAGAKKLNIGAWLRLSYTSGERGRRRPGGGIEFSEVREYAAGDDPRRIDWNVSARHAGLFVKEFIEESDLDIYVAVDYSGSTSFGSGPKSKRDVMVEIAASVMLSALNDRDGGRIGMALFAESLESFTGARRGRRHAMGMIRKMVRDGLSESYRQGKTGIARSMSRLARAAGRRSVMFVISDLETCESLAEALRGACARHEVVIIRVHDPHERTLPDIGYAYLEDMETGGQILVNTSSREVRDAYRGAARQAAERARGEALRAGAAYIDIVAGEPFDAAFNRYAGTVAAGAAAMTTGASKSAARRRGRGR